MCHGCGEERLAPFHAIVWHYTACPSSLRPFAPATAHSLARGNEVSFHFLQCHPALAFCGDDEVNIPILCFLLFPYPYLCSPQPAPQAVLWVCSITMFLFLLHSLVPHLELQPLPSPTTSIAGSCLRLGWQRGFNENAHQYEISSLEVIAEDTHDLSWPSPICHAAARN
jgi:hypothetical protein